ncbi:phosphoenolpyruvate carboxykinase [gtp]-related [Anaeramoeba ignava]|uniref:phosphoenolpyruvate carboxykinase (GTP) n=1 Tax=Anaeramoeba ignava TaxID=1746090 RepID=A0A9Q0LAH4_ANAIG|nr:phosphoenolpyruvate carboxykinase [gtp]-related [Anaeramoeba ignava]|eukprot:Anaeramoba_ignava/a478443_1015.p1 GENE.a478443_1015~~a478443_1015.p1  ORF type:complete len:632 (-),score=82.51 a478443_1015:39-1934(-)
MEKYEKFFIQKQDYQKLLKTQNQKLYKIIQEAIDRMKPKDVVVIDDSKEDRERIRKLAIERGEERGLKIKGHTIHYDAYNDQGRDKANTRVLLEKGETLSRSLSFGERESNLKDIYNIMDGIMDGKTMIIAFFTLGPRNSRFMIPALQITDSFYVTHSEQILYRPGFQTFCDLKNKDDFFYFYHSAGKLVNNVSAELDKRRIYIDPKEERVFSMNNQYAGNSLACKKLALRLAIHRANNDVKEPWLTEHMFLAGFPSRRGDRYTYFTGAFPSGCGKTSTAMIPGGKIVGDDIVYIRSDDQGRMMAVNIEQGCFGIIEDVNAHDDPEIFKAITTPKEVIFSNVLNDSDGNVFWTGCGMEIPDKGINHSGDWKLGNKDSNGKVIPCSHPNSRYTINIDELSNADLENLHNPTGVAVDGILYGGRDPDTTVPVAQALSWEHGVFIGATIMSETTATTISGAQKRIENSPMANFDFLIVPLGKYLTNHINFGRSLKKCPKVFSTNYFLKDSNGKWTNTKLDKKIWIIWAEGIIHNEFSGIETPIGIIPKYDDLKQLFAEFFTDDNGSPRLYTIEEYNEQFSIRVDKYLSRMNSIKNLFKDDKDMPPEFDKEFQRIYDALTELKKVGGVIPPSHFI